LPGIAWCPGLREVRKAYAQRIGERLSEATGAAERQAAAETPGGNLLPVLAARHRVVDESF
jgi:hypothetical protein